MTRAITAEDRWRDALIKLIPAEIVAAYLALQANLIELGDGNVVRVVIVLLTILTYFYLRQFGGVTKLPQLSFSTVAFLVWVYATAPVEILGGYYNPPLASIVLILYSLAIPFFFKSHSGAR